MIQADVLDQLREKNYGDFASLMDHYQAGDWVYPVLIHNKLRMDVVTVYELLEFLTVKNYVTPYLQVYCPNCRHGFCYKTLGEVPSKIDCADCNNEIADPIDHAIVVYRAN